MISAGYSTIYVTQHMVCYCFSSASGLHHQLIVTQENVCACVCCCNHLQSFQPLYFWLPGDRVTSAREDEELKEQRWSQEPELELVLNRIRTKSWEDQRNVYVLNRWPPRFHIKHIVVETRVNRLYRHHVDISVLPHRHSTIILNDFTSLENHFIIFSVFNLTTALQQSANRETRGLLGN